MVFATTAFNSAQVGSSPVNGYYLQTNGSVSTWAPVTGGGGGGGTFSTTTYNTKLLQYPYAQMITSLYGFATTTSPYWLDPFNLQFFVNASTTIAGKLTTSNIIATSTATSTFTGGITAPCFATSTAGGCIVPGSGGGGTNYWTFSGGQLYNNTGTEVGINQSNPILTLDVNGSIGDSNGQLAIQPNGTNIIYGAPVSDISDPSWTNTFADAQNNGHIANFLTNSGNEGDMYISDGLGAGATAGELFGFGRGTPQHTDIYFQPGASSGNDYFFDGLGNLNNNDYMANIIATTLTSNGTISANGTISGVSFAPYTNTSIVFRNWSGTGIGTLTSGGNFNVTGKLSAGSTTPSNALEVNGNAYIAGNASTSNITATGTVYINSVGNLTLCANCSQPDKISGGNSSIFYYENGNYVSQLNVNGSNYNEVFNNMVWGWSSSPAQASTLNAPDTGLSRLSANVVALGNGKYGSATGTLTDSIESIGTTSPFAIVSIQGTFGSTTPLLSIATTTSSAFATSSIFTVNANGTVGISTSTPSNALEVSGNTFLGGNLTATGTLTDTLIPSCSNGLVTDSTGKIQCALGQVGVVATSTVSASTTAGTFLTYTTPASNAMYNINIYLVMTASVTDTVKVTATFTDIANNTFTYSTGTLTTAPNSTSQPFDFAVKGGTTITIASNFPTGGGSITYSAYATISKVSNM